MRHAETSLLERLSHRLTAAAARAAQFAVDQHHANRANFPFFHQTLLVATYTTLAGHAYSRVLNAVRFTRPCLPAALLSAHTKLA